MNIIKLLRDKMQEDNISVSKISNDTGIPASRIYKWLSEKNNPKYEDIKILQHWLIAQGIRINNSHEDHYVLGPINPMGGLVSKEWRVIRMLTIELAIAKADLAALGAKASPEAYQGSLAELERKIDIILNS